MGLCYEPDEGGTGLSLPHHDLRCSCRHKWELVGGTRCYITLRVCSLLGALRCTKPPRSDRYMIAYTVALVMAIRRLAHPSPPDLQVQHLLVRQAKHRRHKSSVSALMVPPVR